MFFLLNPTEKSLSDKHSAASLLLPSNFYLDDVAFKSVPMHQTPSHTTSLLPLLHLLQLLDSVLVELAQLLPYKLVFVDLQAR